MNDQPDKQEDQAPETVASEDAPVVEPMNRAERRHMKKHDGSPDALREFRAQQDRDPHLPHLPGPPLPGHKHSSIGRKRGS